MNILFLHKALSPIGGIETLIIRLLKKNMENDNVSISLLLYQHDSINSGLLKEAYKYTLHLQYYSGWSNPLLFQTLHIAEGYDVIFCMGWRSLLQGFLFRKKYNPQAKICVGVYHSREFCWDPSLKSFSQKLILRILKELPSENIIFMSKESRAEHEKVLKLTFSESPIIPLALNLNKKKLVRQTCDMSSLRIISIGRLVDFKTYNFYMLDVVKSLREKTGLNFEYHVYGDGECFDLLMSEVDNKGLKGICFFHGSIAYEDMYTVLESAWAFVGMGTSLLESASFGVPSIVAIESESRPITYGFVHELNVINCGEIDESLETFMIEDKLVNLAKLSRKDYDAMVRASKDAMKVYDIDHVFDAMIDVFSKAKPDSIHLSFCDRFLDSLTSVWWKAVAILGFKSPLKNRYLKK